MAETDDAFRQLNDAELAALEPLGVRRAVSAGEYLYREGDAGYDFYQLDGALFAPAEVWVTHLASGQTWHHGALQMDLLRRQWLA